jgi:hypothetical protein
MTGSQHGANPPAGEGEPLSAPEWRPPPVPLAPLPPPVVKDRPIAALVTVCVLVPPTVVATVIAIGLSFLCVDYARDRCAFWLTAPVGTWRILLPFVPVVTAVGLVIYGVWRSQPLTAWSAVGLVLLTWPILLMGLAGWP